MENLDYDYLAELVLKAQQGSSDAFAELYAVTYQKQYRYSYKYLRDEYLAQDALQETFIQVLKNIGKLQNPNLFIAWLNQINFRVCYDIQQKQKNYDAELAEYDAEDLENRQAATGRPEDEIVEIDSRRYILNQVMNLPLTESQVILMHYYQNMKIEDVAKLLDISRSTAKRYLKSGKARLAKILRE